MVPFETKALEVSIQVRNCRFFSAGEVAAGHGVHAMVEHGDDWAGLLREAAQARRLLVSEGTILTFPQFAARLAVSDNELQ
jgi:hypothetical protein